MHEANGSLRREETQMHSEMVLLRAANGEWEGWQWMARDEFLRRIRLDTWNEGQVLVGMVLRSARHPTLH
jgi:hypothetical protein